MKPYSSFLSVESESTQKRIFPRDILVLLKDLHLPINWRTLLVINHFVMESVFPSVT